MEKKELERVVLARYDAVAKRFADGARPCCGCGSLAEGPGDWGPTGSCVQTVCCGPAQRERPTHGQEEEEDKAQQDTGESGLGCARLDSLVALYPGEVLLDIGSGPGLETISLARRVDPARAFGLDPVPRMVQVASENARRSGVANVTFLNGSMEDIPLEDESVDVIVSNCVINLSVDKKRAMSEMMRVLRPGGRVAVADIVWLGTPPACVRESAQAWASCIGGALEADEYPELLVEAGFADARLDILHTFDLASLSACVGPGTARREDEKRGREAGGDAEAEDDDAGKGGSQDRSRDGTSGPQLCCSASPEGLALASALVAARKPGFPDGAVEIRRAERADLDLVLRILQAAGLPVAGVEEHFDEFIVACASDGTIVGVAGAERYPSSALLRSVAVLPRWRGLRVGRRLVSSQLARLGRGTPVYLLTTTAEAYFRSLGFQTISRDDVLPEIKQSSEFQGACPQSAVVMRLVLP
ncbi:MAG: GNAT family N-acetyltransferase [Firmicutes bacterium]|nr:GNAT family N-acetyltransferase [Bacillota bacterium]